MYVTKSFSIEHVSTGQIDVVSYRFFKSIWSTGSRCSVVKAWQYWFNNKSFSNLLDISFTVNHHGVQSLEFNVILGVLQGSILGPLLFLIVISGIILDLTWKVVMCAGSLNIFPSISIIQFLFCSVYYFKVTKLLLFSLWGSSELNFFMNLNVSICLFICYCSNWDLKIF